MVTMGGSPFGWGNDSMSPVIIIFPFPPNPVKMNTGDEVRVLMDSCWIVEDPKSFFGLLCSQTMAWEVTYSIQQSKDRVSGSGQGQSSSFFSSSFSSPIIAP